MCMARNPAQLTIIDEMEQLGALAERHLATVVLAGAKSALYDCSGFPIHRHRPF